MNSPPHIQSQPLVYTPKHWPRHLPGVEKALEMKSALDYLHGGAHLSPQTHREALYYTFQPGTPGKATKAPKSSEEKSLQGSIFQQICVLVSRVSRGTQWYHFRGHRQTHGKAHHRSQFHPMPALSPVTPYKGGTLKRRDPEESPLSSSHSFLFLNLIYLLGIL